MKIAFSPCPNDTFIFHALVHGMVPGAPEFEVTFADIDVTNTAALDGRWDIVKVSYAALPWLLKDYQLLPCGGALGRGCGPLLVSKPGQTIRTVAVPGDRTTAYLLFRMWSRLQPYKVEVVAFHEIMPGVAAGRWDAGLVIHEARFTYQRYGLAQVVDLGSWWEEETGLPIPLGAILARPEIAEATTGWIRSSLRMAWDNPGLSRDFVRAHAQEMEDDVIDGHIALYVNDFSMDLGEEGKKAARVLLTRAAEVLDLELASDDVKRLGDLV